MDRREFGGGRGPCEGGAGASSDRWLTWKFDIGEDDSRLISTEATVAKVAKKPGGILSWRADSNMTQPGKPKGLRHRSAISED